MLQDSIFLIEMFGLVLVGEMNELFVRVWCDFEADGLWDERNRMYELDNQPLSTGLKQRIRAWQDKFSAEAEPWLPNDSFDYDGHAIEGEEIARLLKKELPHLDVIAMDRRVNEDGSLGEFVPFPGKDAGD